MSYTAIQGKKQARICALKTCKKPYPAPPKHLRHKRFCSTPCRDAYWNNRYRPGKGKQKTSGLISPAKADRISSR